MIGFLRRRSGPTLADEIAAAVSEREAGRDVALDGPAIEARIKAQPRLARSGDPIIAAVRLGNVFLVRLLLQHGANARMKVTEGTLLHVAAAQGSVAVGHLLIEHGVPVDSRDRHQRTPLIVAAGYGQAEMAVMLLERGADLDAHDQWLRETAIDIAVFQKHFDLARALLVAAGRDGAPTLRTGAVAMAVLAREYESARRTVLERRTAIAGDR